MSASSKHPSQQSLSAPAKPPSRGARRAPRNQAGHDAAGESRADLELFEPEGPAGRGVEVRAPLPPAAPVATNPPAKSIPGAPGRVVPAADERLAAMWRNVLRALQALEKVEGARLPKKEREALAEAKDCLQGAKARAQEAGPAWLEWLEEEDDNRWDEPAEDEEGLDLGDGPVVEREKAERARKDRDDAERAEWLRGQGDAPRPPAVCGARKKTDRGGVHCIREPGHKGPHAGGGEQWKDSGAPRPTHTPGPWSLRPWESGRGVDVVGAAGALVVGLDMKGASEAELETARADLKLMAAAPTMKDALEEQAALLRKFINGEGVSDEELEAARARVQGALAAAGVPA